MRKTRFQLWFDRQIQGGVVKQVGLLLVSAFAVLGVAAFFIYIFTNGHIGTVNGPDTPCTSIKGEQPVGFFWQLYYYFADPGNQMSMHAMNGAQRWIGAIVSTLGSFFLGGLLVSTFSNIISQRVDKINKGLAYYRFEGHTIIIGSDRMLHGIIRQLIERGDERIVVMTSTDVESLRKSIEANLDDASQMSRIVVNFGVRDSDEYLNKIRITDAQEVFILGDTSEFDDIESYHDTLNIQCLHHISDLCKRAERPGKLTCHVAFEYMTTYNIFQYADLPKETRKHIEFKPFNPYELWAEKVLVSGESPKNHIEYPPLDRTPITSTDDNRYVHLIIIGMSRMGQALANMAAHIAHYPNYRKRKTRITIIDQNGRAEMNEYKQKCGELFEVSKSTFIDCTTPGSAPQTTDINTSRYKHLAQEAFIDIEWTFIQGADNNPEVRKLLQQYAEDDEAIVTVAVCLNITHISLRSAMHLPAEYYEKGIPVFVQQRNSSALVTTLKESRYKHLRPFGMTYGSYDLKMEEIERYARRINAVYSYYSEHHSSPAFIDDSDADRQWENVITSKRWSNIYAAYTIPTKLRSIGVDWKSGNYISALTDKNVAILAEMEHARWNVEELLLGWRPVTQKEAALADADRSKKKDKTLRYHDDIRPYDDLKPDDQGNPANMYDIMIVKNIPLIINKQ